MLKAQLIEVNKSIEKIERKHFILEEMDQETYSRWNKTFKEEKDKILEELEHSTKSISNLSEGIKSAINFASNLPSMWASGSFALKEKLQKLIFPVGVEFDKEREAFRTDKINSVIFVMSSIVKDLKQNKRGQWN